MDISLMKHIFFLKVLPLIASVHLMLFLLFYDSETKIWGMISFSFLILSGIVPIWRQFAKVQTIQVTNETILIDGLKIERSLVLGWRSFHALNYGMRSRYIEFKLAKLPSATWGWRLTKLFERVPNLNRVEKRIPLAKEPRIIVSLYPWDAKGSEIIQALENSEKPKLLGDDIPSTGSQVLDLRDIG